ncbi:hypothetical protein PMAYCL1PPCAC_33348, partial [Pristionchus mayeri]
HELSTPLRPSPLPSALLRYASLFPRHWVWHRHRTGIRRWVRVRLVLRWVRWLRRIRWFRRVRIRRRLRLRWLRWMWRIRHRHGMLWQEEVERRRKRPQFGHSSPFIILTSLELALLLVKNFFPTHSI